MDRPKIRLGFLVLAGLVLALAALAGCSSSQVTRRGEARLDPATSGAQAAVVFADPSDPALLVDGDESFRSDASLSPSFPVAMMATDQWPEAARPDPRQARRVLINQRPETYIYFERGYQRGGSWRDGGYGHRHEPSRGGYDRRYKPGW